MSNTIVCVAGSLKPFGLMLNFERISCPIPSHHSQSSTLSFPQESQILDAIHQECAPHTLPHV